MLRVLSPSGGSTLITSAPMSAMICVQYGPNTIAVRSTTRTPVSGPLCMKRPLLGHREAVPDVVAMAVGNDGKDDGCIHFPDCRNVLPHFRDRPRRPIHAGSFRDDRLGHPSRQRDEHLPSDRT